MKYRHSYKDISHFILLFSPYTVSEDDKGIRYLYGKRDEDIYGRYTYKPYEFFSIIGNLQELYCNLIRVNLYHSKEKEVDCVSLSNKFKELLQDEQKIKRVVSFCNKYGLTGNHQILSPEEVQISNITTLPFQNFFNDKHHYYIKKSNILDWNSLISTLITRDKTRPAYYIYQELSQHIKLMFKTLHNNNNIDDEYKDLIVEDLNRLITDSKLLTLRPIMLKERLEDSYIFDLLEYGALDEISLLHCNRYILDYALKEIVTQRCHKLRQSPLFCQEEILSVEGIIESLSMQPVNEAINNIYRHCTKALQEIITHYPNSNCSNKTLIVSFNRIINMRLLKNYTSTFSNSLCPDEKYLLNKIPEVKKTERDRILHRLYLEHAFKKKIKRYVYQNNNNSTSGENEKIITVFSMTLENILEDIWQIHKMLYIYNLIANKNQEHDRVKLISHLDVMSSKKTLYNELASLKEILVYIIYEKVKSNDFLPLIKYCPNCRKPFKVTARSQKYCSSRCEGTEGARKRRR